MGRKHFKGFSVEKTNIKIKLSMEPTERAIGRAQYALDGAIMTSMVRFMPMVDGPFIQLTRAKSASVQGSGQVYAGVGPQGRFLYEGKVMVDPVTNNPWARKGSKKVVTDRELTFSKLANHDAQKEWFFPAKRADQKKWVDKAQSALKEK